MSQHRRIDLIDVLRGFAFVQMFLFHFCFVLYEFNLAFETFTKDPWWLYFRTLIVSQFLILVGVSLKLASADGLKSSNYLKRLLQIFTYGWMVVLVTFLIAPNRFVVFGILQFILVASIVGLAFQKFGRFNLLIAFLWLAFGNFYQSEFFNQSFLHWIGFMTIKPVTLDYVPVFPWFGMILVGIFIGDRITRLTQQDWIKSWRADNLLNKTLVLFGRHSLNLYMLHMPLIFVFVYLLAELK